MAVILYRKGDADVVRGVTCEAGRFAVSSMAGALKSGWVSNPNDLVNSNVEKSEEKSGEEKSGEEATSKKEDESEENAGLLEPTNSVRAAAKAAGIEGWEKKRIKTLEAELSNGN